MRPLPLLATSAAAQYLVIVAREETLLCRYLQRQFSSDPNVRVFTDRRRPERQGALPLRERWWRQDDRRGRRDVAHELHCRLVVIVRSQEAVSPLREHHITSPEGQERSKGHMEGPEERQRVDQWIKESQHLLGRIIPGLFEDRDRLRNKVEEAEQERERLRREIGELQKQVSDIQSETRHFRSEYAAMAEALGAVLEHMDQIQKPVRDVYQRLRLVQQVGSPSPTE
jgi:hypothetical protein